MRTLSYLSLVVATFFSLEAHAYSIKQFFNTTHYSVNEVILEKDEALTDEVQKNIVTSMQKLAQDDKYQSITAVFPTGSTGLKGNVAQKLSALITISQYKQGEANIKVLKDDVYATDVGITLNKDLLLTLANNRVMAPLLDELKQLPLILADMEVEQNTQDYRGQRFYTFKERGYVIDAAIIDSLFYDENTRAKVKNGCKVTLMAIPDRLSADVPLFMAVHASVNSIKCKDDAQNKK